MNSGRRLLGNSRPDLTDRLRALADTVKFHADTSDAVAIVADISGHAAADVAAFGKTLGSALALARAQAQNEGAADLAEILEHARIVPDGDARFRAELALPVELLRRQLGACAGAANPR